MPDYRLRNLLRSFCRQFLSSCPVDLHGPVLAPFLVHLFPAMLQRLSGKWEAAMALTQQQQANKEEETDILVSIYHAIIFYQFSTETIFSFIGNHSRCGRPSFDARLPGCSSWCFDYQCVRFIIKQPTNYSIFRGRRDGGE